MIIKQGTAIGRLVIALYVVILYVVCWLILSSTEAYKTSQFHGMYNLALLVLPAIWLLSLIVRHWYEIRALQSHTAAIAAYNRTQASALVLPPEISLQQARQFDFVSLSGIKDARDIRHDNYVEGDGWLYCELSYRLYRRSKYGDYHSETVYYSIMAAELPRTLPNVFFDAKQARGRQFRFQFARSQLHSLEGDFDTYFATYFPEQYTIDSMSFISPDTMLALRDARDYDIEIVGNKLYLYGALGEPSKQLPDMSAKLLAIKSQLLDTILTYRDERLPYQQGRERVTPLALNLKRSKFWQYVSLGIGVVYFIACVLVQIYVD